jgi:hypothetical protein
MNKIFFRKNHGMNFESTVDAKNSAAFRCGVLLLFSRALRREGDRVLQLPIKRAKYSVSHLTQYHKGTARRIFGLDFFA